MELDMSNIKPTVLSAITVFLMVAITVPLAKWLLNKYHVPGFTDLVNSI